MYSDVGLLTESELTKIFGVQLKDLGIRPKKDFVTLQSQEEGKALNVLPVSLLSMPPEIAQGIRKIRLFHQSEVEGAEHLLLMQHQLSQEAPSNWLDFATRKHITSRPTPLQASQRHGLLLWSTLEEKANATLQGRDAHMEASDAEGADGERADQEDEDAFFEDEDEVLRPASAPVAGLGSFGSVAVEATPKTKAKAKAKRRSKGAAPTEEIAEEPEVMDISSSSAAWTNDEDMKSVHEKHVELGYPPAGCLQKMDISRFFNSKAGDKLGNVLNGAACSVAECSHCSQRSQLLL